MVIARDLHIDVTVEGVETEQQAALLRSRRCNSAQGFLYSPARPPGEVPGLVERIPRVALQAEQAVRAVAETRPALFHGAANPCAGAATRTPGTERRMPKVVISEFMDEAAIARARAASTPCTTRSRRPARRLAAAGRRRRADRAQPDAGARRAPRRRRASPVVGRLGVGLDNIDVPACAARGIAVFPATGANDGAVAEYVVATAMLLLRGAYGASAAVAAGAWPRNALMGREIAGKRLGLVGFGRSPGRPPAAPRRSAWRSSPTTRSSPPTIRPGRRAAACSAGLAR